MEYTEIKLPEEISVSCSEKKVGSLYIKQPDGLFLMDNPTLIDAIPRSQYSAFTPFMIDHAYAGKSDDKGLVRSDLKNVPLGVQVKMTQVFADFFVDGMLPD